MFSIQYSLLVKIRVKISVKIECPNVLTNNHNLQKGIILYIIIGYVYKFIGHCLIPLDPWVFMTTIFMIESVSIIIYYVNNMPYRFGGHKI